LASLQQVIREEDKNWRQNKISGEKCLSCSMVTAYQLSVTWKRILHTP
jgi:hypothetical protein